MAFERYLTIPEAAELTGFSYKFIKNACDRGKAFHPLPYIPCGEKRPIKKITLSDFYRWLQEEKSL